eukprot:7965021-Prorocentrum_lima.AAC.1
MQFLHTPLGELTRSQIESMTLEHYIRRHEIEQALAPPPIQTDRARTASVYMLIHASTAGFADKL